MAAQDVPTQIPYQASTVIREPSTSTTALSMLLTTPSTSSLLGSYAEFVDRAFEQATEFTMDLQHYITDVCWGGIWGREGSTKRDRSLINLDMLTALNRSQELRGHVRGANSTHACQARLQNGSELWVGS